MDKQVLQIIGMTLFAGMAMPIGALIASVENIHRQWLRSGFRRTVMAFGGGALLSAVALVLVPEGAKQLNVFSAAACFASGGAAFMVFDILLDRIKSPAGNWLRCCPTLFPRRLRWAQQLFAVVLLDYCWPH